MWRCNLVVKYDCLTPKKFSLEEYISIVQNVTNTITNFLKSRLPHWGFGKIIVNLQYTKNPVADTVSAAFSTDEVSKATIRQFLKPWDSFLHQETGPQEKIVEVIFVARERGQNFAKWDQISFSSTKLRFSASRVAFVYVKDGQLCPLESQLILFNPAIHTTFNLV